MKSCSYPVNANRTRVIRHTGCSAYAIGVADERLHLVARSCTSRALVADSTRSQGERVGVLVWWLLPLLATVVAIGGLWWKGRTGAGEPGWVRSIRSLNDARAIEAVTSEG